MKEKVPNIKKYKNTVSGKYRIKYNERWVRHNPENFRSKEKHKHHLGEIIEFKNKKDCEDFIKSLLLVAADKKGKWVQEGKEMAVDRLKVNYKGYVFIPEDSPFDLKVNSKGYVSISEEPF